MARVTPIEVKEIIDTGTEDTDAEATDKDTKTITACIEAANLTVTKLLGATTDLSAAQKKEIERWLAAHLLASGPDRQVDEEWVEDAKAKYSGKTDKGLDSTMYGQTVKILDTTGILAESLGKQKASSTAVTSFS